jgi:hypothetical protein
MDFYCDALMYFHSGVDTAAMTPSRPAPSKLLNQSDATFSSRVAGVRWTGGTALASSDPSFSRRCSKGSVRQSRFPSLGRSKKGPSMHDSAGKKFCPRDSWMNPKL